MSPEIPAADGSSPQTQRFDGPPPVIIDPEKRYTAEVVTSKGTMTIALDPLAAPKTVNNFVFLARWHYYDGIVFHRIIPGFMLQGGDPEGSGRGGPGYRFEDELPAQHLELLRGDTVLQLLTGAARVADAEQKQGDAGLRHLASVQGKDGREFVNTVPSPLDEGPGGGVVAVLIEPLPGLDLVLPGALVGSARVRQ